MAANRLAKHCLEVGDFKMHDEMVALANSYVARAASETSCAALDLRSTSERAAFDTAQSKWKKDS